jgi:hypothetical protein
MAAAAKARWAARKGQVAQTVEVKTETTSAAEPEKPKKKRNISEAGRRAMSLAGKRRWAKARRAGKVRV